MPGVHKNNTLSFRPEEWERVLIEEKAALSGMTKRKFIAHSCIYSNVCVIGTKNNVQRIIDSVEEMRNVLSEIASSKNTGDFPVSMDTFEELSMRYTALCLSLVEILDGASYLFGREKNNVVDKVEKESRLKELFSTLHVDYESGDIER